MNKAEKIISLIDMSDIWQGMLCELIKYSKTNQVVELGAGEGMTTGLMTKVLPKNGKIYSADISPVAWGRLPQFGCDNWEEKVVKLVGDDVDPNLWKGIDLAKTGVWEIDSDHSFEHLEAEWALFSPYFHEGTIIAVDDLHMSEVKRWWDQVKEEKWDNGRVGVIAI